ncbi:MAG: hypothetical protein KTR29_17000 [Rhodothermaceae bacterium]|nr:hypothetical protein [Rhodothermaceae bacterium]
MSHQHDPVSALKEHEATGETADLFAEIRDVMHIPMLTSIWRILAHSLDDLRTTWHLTKPLFGTGYPDHIYQNLDKRISFPEPPPLSKQELQATGISAKELKTLQSIVHAYTRSNSLNMIALTALVVEPAGQPADFHPAPPRLDWPALPSVLEKQDISPSTWSLIHALNAFGSTPDQPGLATLWRHLAYWPEFLKVVHAAFAPLQENQEIKQCIQEVLNEINWVGQQLAHHRVPSPPLPESIRTQVAQYVQHPGLVVRMVVIGHSLASWLQAAPPPSSTI